MKTGWMCPRCGVCWSPKVERCECKPQATAPQYPYPYWYWPSYWQWPYNSPWRITVGGATTISNPLGATTSGTYAVNANASSHTPGLSAGKVWMSDDFDAPLSGEMGFGEA